MSWTESDIRKAIKNYPTDGNIKALVELQRAEKKGSKYGNIKTEVDGIVFDSKKEAERYCELKILEKAGEISGLKLQPEFVLHEKNGNQRAIKYKADFQYYDKVEQAEIVEDVKGWKTQIYKMKKKMFLAIYGEKYKFLET